MIILTSTKKSATRKREKKFYLTTAIPYVNAAPHLGHALEFVQTDVIARYHKILSEDAFLTTGADENSLKNVHAAEAKKITPAQLCEQNAAVFKQLIDRIQLSCDSFIRSSIKEEHWKVFKNYGGFAKNPVTSTRKNTKDFIVLAVNLSTKKRSCLAEFALSTRKNPIL